jgi:hypothetical protein
MSIWTSSALAALACAGLSACAGFDLAPQTRSISVLGGAVTVAPPKGYCANPKVSKTGGDNAVVLIGRCTALSPVVPALLTTSIGAAGSGSALDAGPVALTSFFTSDQGRAMLASSGNAKDAVVTASETAEGAVLLLIKDRSLGEYWRGIMALRGRLVMVSAAGVEGNTLAPADGRALLAQTIVSLRRANAEATGPLAVAPKAGAADSAAAPTGLRPKIRPRVPISG